MKGAGKPKRPPMPTMGKKMPPAMGEPQDGIMNNAPAFKKGGAVSKKKRK